MANSDWTFLSNHSHVLVCIARKPEIRVRDIAVQVGITERAILRLMAELKEAGILACKRVGRRNHYTINLEGELRHELEAGVAIGALLREFVGAGSRDKSGRQGSKKTSKGNRSAG